MTLYLYKIGESVPAITIENVAAYTADSVTTADGGIYAPLAEGYELSSLPDCSETLRADWRAEHETGSVEERVAALEDAVASGLNLYEGDLGNG